MASSLIYYMYKTQETRYSFHSNCSLPPGPGKLSFENECHLKYTETGLLNVGSYSQVKLCRNWAANCPGEKMQGSQCLHSQCTAGYFSARKTSSQTGTSSREWCSKWEPRPCRGIKKGVTDAFPLHTKARDMNLLHAAKEEMGSDTHGVTYYDLEKTFFLFRFRGRTGEETNGDLEATWRSKLYNRHSNWWGSPWTTSDWTTHAGL